MDPKLSVWLVSDEHTQVVYTFEQTYYCIHMNIVFYASALTRVYVNVQQIH